MKKILKLTVLAFVVFVLSSTMAYAFSDINDKNADFLAQKGILTGYEDGTFKPENSITRAEFSAVMCRALGLLDYAESLKGEQIFADVPTSHWACGYINALYRKEIINGVGDGNFAPASTITHAQVSKIIAGSIGYTDSDAAHYGGYPEGWQKIADIVGFSNETDDINSPINRIGVVNAICESGIVYKEPEVVATVDDLKKGDKAFLATVERLDVGMADDFPYRWHLLGLTNLREVTCSPENPSYKVVDGVLYNNRMDHLALYPAKKPGKSFTIPATVNGIWPGAFYNCKYLTEIDFGKNLRMICEDAFAGCKFRSIILSPELRTIHEGAFKNCKYLEEVDISCPELSAIWDSNLFEGGNEDMRLYSSNDPRNVVFNFASKFGYSYNEEKLEYLAENFYGVYVGMSHEKAKTILTEFDVLASENGDKWAVYGSYDKFVAIYYKNDKVDFIFTTDLTQNTLGASPFIDPLGPGDWGLGLGNLPLMNPDEANEIMIGHFVNAYRAHYGLPTLEYDKDLADISRYHSENMASTGILDHNLNGESPSDRLVKFKYNYTSYAENIAKGPYWITDAVYGWIASEGHRENFLTKGVTKMGVGISRKNRFYTWMAASGSSIKDAEPQDSPNPVIPDVPGFDINSVVQGDTVPDGTYVIATKLDPTYVLDIYGGYTNNGTNVQMWHKNNTSAQSFIVTHIGDGYYTIVNQNSGKAIDAQNGGTRSGTNVWQYEINNTAAQIWKIVPDKDYCFYIINKASGLYLDVNLADAYDGANVKLYDRNDAYNAQRWYFVKVGQ